MARVEYEAVHAGEIDVVSAALVDEAFLAEYAKETGAIDWDIDVDREPELTRSRLRLTVPTQGIPQVFKRFVGPTLEIIEVREWPVSQPAEVRNGRIAVDATVSKRDARVRGVVALKTVPTGTRFSMAGDISVNLPLVGERAAGLVKDVILRTLGQQTKVMDRWIG